MVCLPSILARSKPCPEFFTGLNRVYNTKLFALHGLQAAKLPDHVVQGSPCSPQTWNAKQFKGRVVQYVPSGMSSLLSVALSMTNSKLEFGASKQHHYVFRISHTKGQHNPVVSKDRSKQIAP